MKNIVVQVRILPPSYLLSSPQYMCNLLLLIPCTPNRIWSHRLIVSIGKIHLQSHEEFDFSLQGAKRTSLLPARTSMCLNIDKSFFHPLWNPIFKLTSTDIHKDQNLWFCNKPMIGLDQKRERMNSFTVSPRKYLLPSSLGHMPHKCAFSGNYFLLCSLVSLRIPFVHLFCLPKCSN